MSDVQRVIVLHPDTGQEWIDSFCEVTGGRVVEIDYEAVKAAAWKRAYVMRAYIDLSHEETVALLDGIVDDVLAAALGIGDKP